MKVIESQGPPIDVGFSVTIAREGKINEGLNMGNPAVPTNMELFTTQDNKLNKRS